MLRILAQLGCLLLVASVAWSDSTGQTPALPPPAARPVDFAHDIKPLFESSCIQCHAKGKEKSGFNLETRARFLKGGDTGPAAVVGNSSQSLVVRLVAGVDPDSQMPKKGKKWTAEQVGLLRAWIDQGAKWDDSITFARPEPANLKPHVIKLPAGEESHPVDRLLDSYFRTHAITPAEPVNDRAFARRVYLDVVGLLPTAEQLEAFAADPSANKRGELVRTLLADKRGYADHWLTFWNDLLRNDYRGTGFIDGGRKQISGWLYAALYRNEPYDKFVAQLIDPCKACEGFSRGIIWRGTVNASMMPPMQAAQNISQIFMGVNLKCASCHDSFINDWTLADAYGLAAVYSDGPLELVHCDKPTGKTADARFIYPQIGTIDAKLNRANRLERLAEVITGPADGRLSRTIVNRLWARLLGRGLVEPVDDMDKPSWEPELLDWLAEDLVAHDYDLKRTIEMILTSRAYQLPAIESAAGEKQYVFRGPLPRRMTAEQFCDAISEFSGDWARFPATLDIDFAVDPRVGPVTMPTWIWTDQSVEAGQQRAQWQHEMEARTEKKKPETAKLEETKKEDTVAAKAEDGKKKPASKPAADDEDDPTKARSSVPGEKSEQLPRHHVVFRRRFQLEDKPKEAYAAISASQSFVVFVNGKVVRPFMADGLRRGRVALYDLASRLVAGDNVVVLDVASHTDKSMNDIEKQQYPASRNHLNKISGVGFYLRAKFDEGRFDEVTSDPQWRVFRAPDGKDWKQPGYDDSEWVSAVALPQGVGPFDEGPGLPPITRKDFANEPVEFTDAMRSAVSTAIQPGGIRASLVGADALMIALDRPNREQVMTVRSTAPSTLQALELAQGSSLDNRLKRAAKKLLPRAKEDPKHWIVETYRQALARDPTDQELQLCEQMLGDPVSEEGVADLLWAVTMLPEFQLIQ